MAKCLTWQSFLLCKCVFIINCKKTIEFPNDSFLHYNNLVRPDHLVISNIHLRKSSAFFHTYIQMYNKDIVVYRKQAGNYFMYGQSILLFFFLQSFKFPPIIRVVEEITDDRQYSNKLCHVHMYYTIYYEKPLNLFKVGQLKGDLRSILRLEHHSLYHPQLHFILFCKYIKQDLLSVGLNFQNFQIGNNGVTDLV